MVLSRALYFIMHPTIVLIVVVLNLFQFALILTIVPDDSETYESFEEEPGCTSKRKAQHFNTGIVQIEKEHRFRKCDQFFSLNVRSNNVFVLPAKKTKQNGKERRLDNQRLGGSRCILPFNLKSFYFYLSL